MRDDCFFTLPGFGVLAPWEDGVDKCSLSEELMILIKTTDGVLVGRMPFLVTVLTPDVF